MTTIAINMVIEWTEDQSTEDVALDRVIWITGSGDRCVTIRLFDRAAFPVWQPVKEIEEALQQGLALKRTLDPYAWYSSPSEEFLLKHRDHRDHAWEVIKDIATEEPAIFDEKERGRLIKAVEARGLVTKKTVYKYLRRYWAGGKIINALLPDYNQCGAYGKQRPVLEKTKKRGRPSLLSRQSPEKIRPNVGEDIKKIIHYAIDKYFSTGQETTLRKTYNTMLQKHFHIGFTENNGKKIPIIPPTTELPSFDQFKYWASKFIDLDKTLRARKGDRNFVLKHRAVLGDSTQLAYGPGTVYQIDATVADVYLVNKLNRNRIIGRPIVYVCIDVFSRTLAGIHVGLEGPSWLGAMMAVANATSSKVEYCARYGISITAEEWPCHYLPQRIMADRGEFISNASDSLVEGLGVIIDNTPPYRADWKGIVEQYFRCLNLKGVKWLPGAVRKRERGEKDCRLDAQLDIEQFTKILILNAIRHNRNQWVEDYPLTLEMIADGIDPIPLTMWNWGVQNCVGRLQEASQDRVRLALMPRDTARVTGQGIVFQGLHYSCERALREQWFVHARKSGRWSLEASYDPRRLETIYLHLHNEPVETCNLLDKDARFAECTYEDYLDEQYHKKVAKSRHEDDRNQGQADCDAQVNAVLEEAARMKQENPSFESNRQRVLGINDNRRDEKMQRRGEDAWRLNTDSDQDSPDLDVGSVPSPEKQSEPESIPSKRATFLSILKQQRSKKDEDPS